jgi:hypothetical protein
MATQTVEFFAAPSQTITAKLFAPSSDTEVASVTATEQTNRKGVYRAAYTDIAAGLYRLLALVGTTPIATWWVDLTLTTATFQSYEIPTSVFAGTDWTADERTAIRSILGVPTSGTTPTDPTVGILDAIRDKTTNLPASPAAVSDIPTANQNRDAVWNAILTGATYNIASSAGRRLRQLASVIVRAGTAQGPGTGNNQIQLDAGASATNGDYDPGLIFIETGTGAGQARLILQYNGSTKVATVDRDWRVNPDNTSEFVILADAGRNSVNEGLAQAATATTITLNANASSSDDAYNGQLVFIRSGTGQDQVALVEDYVGSTKVATIRTRSTTGQWSVVPDTTSSYMMIPNLTFTLNEISSAVAATQALSRLDSMIESNGAGQFRFDTIALSMAAGGGGGGTVNIVVEDRSITVE